MAIKLNSTGGGSVTLDSPSTASNYTVTLPSAAGTLATTTGTGSVFTNPTINGFTGDTSAITVGTTQFVKDTSGNIGIGTATPGYRLDIQQATAAGYVNAANFKNTDATGYVNVAWSSGTAVSTIRYAPGVFFKIGPDSGDTTSPIVFATNNATERMRLDSSGNLGIGTSSPSAPLHIYANTSKDIINLNYSVLGKVAGVYIDSTNVYYGGGTNNYTNAFSVAHQLNYASIYTNGSERARIDSSGNLLVAKTSSSDTTVGHNLYATGAYTSTMASATSAQSTLNVYSTGASAYRFYVDMGGTVHATSAIITAISDQRLKENIQDLDVGLNAILALRPRKFDWRAGKGKDIKGDRGFIAQEFEEVFPDLIDTWKDPAPEGEEPYKSVRQDLIPVLVKALQELSAQNNALEARLAKLEAK